MFGTLSSSFKASWTFLATALDLLTIAIVRMSSAFDLSLYMQQQCKSRYSCKCLALRVYMAAHCTCMSLQGGVIGKAGRRLLLGTRINTEQTKAAETPVPALQHETLPANHIKSVADALYKRDHSSQPDGSKHRGEPRQCEQAECSSPVGTEVQVCICAYQCRTLCSIQPFLQSVVSFTSLV